MDDRYKVSTVSLLMDEQGMFSSGRRARVLSHAELPEPPDVRAELRDGREEGGGPGVRVAAGGLAGRQLHLERLQRVGHAHRLLDVCVHGELLHVRRELREGRRLDGRAEGLGDVDLLAQLGDGRLAVVGVLEDVKVAGQVADSPAAAAQHVPEGVHRAHRGAESGQAEVVAGGVGVHAVRLRGRPHGRPGRGRQCLLVQVVLIALKTSTY
eukprot:scaffold340633_cov29-Prasinocladus_malaysianus.AAC.1